MRKLYVLRGLPGSGKSTYARTLAQLVAGPDMFRYDENNEYEFDSTRNMEVNAKAQMLCEFAMRTLKLQAVAVTATFTKTDMVMQYVRLGRKYGYSVTVIECVGDHGNVHGVPEKVLLQMREGWEPFDAELANQEGVSLWLVEDGVRNVLYVPEKERA